jgi:hypothetical protein
MPYQRQSPRCSYQEASSVSAFATSAQIQGRLVVELDCGVMVYPARREGDRWRAVWVEDGRRRYLEGVTEQRLAVKLEKVVERLSADAPNMERPGTELIAFYLSPDRLPADRQWSRKHAHTQRRLCERFAVPVISGLACQDITTGDMQQIVNAAPTPGEGARARGMISALVSAGITGGYLASARLKEVHWQAGDRLLPPPQVSVAGESQLFVDPADIPAAADVAALGHALGAGRRGGLDELMAHTAAYSGLRWGELAALTADQIDQAGRVITVDRKIVEIAGTCTWRHPRTANGGRPSTPAPPPPATPSPRKLQPAPTRPAPNSTSAPTRWG